eukprot:TRINITY_DN2742_c0_g2_i2.p1 TRINITY_DN2742_c0_g2~~TRINITY_DN2742_c0_g2_i2.p1  ORF type:complete len:289 (+),score=68.53 TRINITY_DN2742_c0_g2_i2:944-1810(+)
MPGKYVYFEYGVEYTKEKQYLHVFARPGPDKIRCFSSIDSMYPSERRFLTETTVYSSIIFEGFSVGLSPFVLNADNQIEYRQDPKGILARDNRNSKDSVALLIETENWKYAKGPCYISAKNVSASPVTITISLRGSRGLLVEIAETDVLNKEMLRKYNIFSRMFGSIDGSRISHKQRGEQKLKGSEFTYGEIHFLHFLPVLSYAADCHGGSNLVFWDLGAGAGKVLIAAALAERFSKVCGVEFLEGLYEAGKEACARFEKVAEEELSLIHICRCRRLLTCRSRWSPYH